MLKFYIPLLYVLYLHTSIISSFYKSFTIKKYIYNHKNFLQIMSSLNYNNPNNKTNNTFTNFYKNIFEYPELTNEESYYLFYIINFIL
jgi:hypothetical protein